MVGFPIPFRNDPQKGLRQELSRFAESELRRELATLRESIVRDLTGDILRRSNDPLEMRWGPTFGNEAKKVDASRGARTGRNVRKQPQYSSGGYAPIPLSDPYEDKYELNTFVEEPQAVTRTSVSYESPADRPSLLMSIVLSNKYILLSCSVILANAIWMGFQTDYAARNWLNEGGAPYAHKIHQVEQGFCAIFLADILLRLCAFGIGFFHWGWNWFDLVLALSQSIELYARRLLVGSALYCLKYIVILRLVRVWRIIRDNEPLHSLKAVILSIVRSTQQMFSLLLIVVVLTYGFGIVLTEMVTNFKQERTPEELEEIEGGSFLLENFGSLDRSMLALYKAISEGLHWGELARPLSQQISPWLNFIFCLYMSLLLFGVMNVVIAHVLKTAMTVVEEEEASNLGRSIFNMFTREFAGADKRGNVHKQFHIDEEMFYSAYPKPQMQEFLRLLGIDDNRAAYYNLFELIDTDASGAIESEELSAGMMRLTGFAKAVDVLRLCHSFDREKEAAARHRHAVENALRTLVVRPPPASTDASVVSEPTLGDSRAGAGLRGGAGARAANGSPTPSTRGASPGAASRAGGRQGPTGI
eukprot:TRINITY_DN1995_c0_g1_i1.p1 TRINITY_DN1995_c0_g1~~TRINITY_DN1995_c0_g1_i1.p1  ORF type:complete len:588 (+),score=124.09 TRINITY_DN1995_c0_g1_i1:148-1911(+)